MPELDNLCFVFLLQSNFRSFDFIVHLLPFHDFIRQVDLPNKTIPYKDLLETVTRVCDAHL